MQRMGTTGRRGTILITLWCLANLGGSSAGLAQTVPQTIPELGVESRFDGMVDVGGYRLHARVYGDGEPAVVLVYGLGGFQDYFNDIVTGLAPHTTVITYDRGGYEQSEHGDRPRTATVTTDELLALLRGMEIPGPYILVGHSLGASFVHLFATRFPTEVAGIVFLDHTHPSFLRDFEATLTEEERVMFEEIRTRMLSGPPPPGGTGEDIRLSLENLETLRAAGPIPDVPLVVMTSPFEGRITPLHRELSETSLSRFLPMQLEYAEKLAAMSSKGRLIQVEGVTHHFPLEKPDVVVQAILGVLAEARDELGREHDPDQHAERARGVPTTASEFLQRVAEIREYVQAFVDSSAVPGVSVALAIGDTFTRFEAFGYADLESSQPVTPQTRFRIGSVSKALTAAALGLLVEEGRLDLDAEVRRYVPEFPEKGSPITLRQLAGHQGGVRHYEGQEAYSDREFESVLDALSVFAGDPLVAEPGTAFSYSTHGYTLLSAAMERGSRMPFLALMRERVLEPLRMTRTEPEVGGRSLPDQATGYELDPDGQPRKAPHTNLSNKWAGGGYVSTAGDMLRFVRAHLTGSLLRPETLSLLWTPQTTAEGTETHYGVGWQMAPMSDGRRLLVAGGSAIGGTTVVFVLPEEEVVVVFMTNMGNAPIRGVPMRVLLTLLGEEVAATAVTLDGDSSSS